MSRYRATLFLNRLVEDPKRFFPYARLYASSVAAVLAWGFRAKTLDSFWFKDVSAMIEEVGWLINYAQAQPLINSYSGSKQLNLAPTRPWI